MTMISDIKLSILNFRNGEEIRTRLGKLINNKYSGILPLDKSASILIKPNFNSNMNALTGNTTDLRLLAAIIEYLKELGYSNITIGEGNNSGFFRAGVDVMSRLRIDKLAKYYDVKVVDFNYAEFETIELEAGIKANIARECLESDFFINVPKLKTHFETEMTVCLKSLIGCLVGRDNKKKVHSSLIKNILKLNEAIKPDIHIVDGLVAMEGSGPSRGEPKKIDTILIGTNPYLIDMVASKIAGYEDFREIPVLKKALKKKKIDDSLIDIYKNTDVQTYNFKRPEVNFLVDLTINPKIQKYLIKIRYALFVNKIFNWKITRRILFDIGISQDYIVFKEPDISTPYLSDGNCMNGCSICQDVCPLGINLPEDFVTEKMNKCIKCLYCYSVCPEKNISVNGDLGFFNQQLKQYDEKIRDVFRKSL